jgi:hypothetical protein
MAMMANDDGAEVIRRVHAEPGQPYEMVLESLPARVRDRLEGWRVQRDRAWAARRWWDGQLRAASDALERVETVERAARERWRPSDGEFDDARFRAQIASHRRALEVVRGEQGRAEAYCLGHDRWFDTALGHLRAWRPSTIDRSDRLTLRAPEPDDAARLEELARLRDEIARVQATIEAVKTAPPLLTEALAALGAFIDHLGAEFDYRSLASITSAGAAWDVIAKFVAAALPEELKARLGVALTRRYEKFDLVVSSADKPARLAALQREIRALETAEEELIIAGELAGYYVARRVEADVDTVLAVEVPTPPAAAEDRDVA